MSEFLHRDYGNRNIEIIAHRGWWKAENEKNTKTAFERAFDSGFGVETDLRDIKGEIVISHNMPQGNEMSFEDILKLLDGRALTLALNIKADGMADEIKRLLEKYKVLKYFTFDMSIPEMVYQHKTGLNVFTGFSDIVPEPVMYEQAKGVWLDCFKSDWFGEAEIQNIINQGKKVCIVSPDLHKREYKSVWKKYKNMNGIMLCTDYPQEAEEYFNDKN